MECVDVEEMYQNYAKPIYCFLLSLSHSPDVAEELTAETFYQAIRCINRYDGSCSLKSWLFQISKHLWLRYCRKARQETPQAVSDLAAESCTMEEAAIDGEEKISFYKKLSALDEPYKTVVFLRLASDLTFQEIGQILDKNGTWARVSYYRAKERLKKLYEKE